MSINPSFCLILATIDSLPVPTTLRLWHYDNIRIRPRSSSCSLRTFSTAAISTTTMFTLTSLYHVVSSCQHSRAPTVNMRRCLSIPRATPTDLNLSGILIFWAWLVFVCTEVGTNLTVRIIISPLWTVRKNNEALTRGQDRYTGGNGINSWLLTLLEPLVKNLS